jgi:hypothetical protein
MHRFTVGKALPIGNGQIPKAAGGDDAPRRISLNLSRSGSYTRKKESGSDISKCKEFVNVLSIQKN